MNTPASRPNNQNVPVYTEHTCAFRPAMEIDAQIAQRKAKQILTIETSFLWTKDFWGKLK